MSRTHSPRLYHELDANTRARLTYLRAEQLETAPAFEPKYFVQATGLGNWAGKDPIDSIHRVRGELGTPHLSYLPALPQRGYASTTLARTIATFEELGVDGASFGWRLHEGHSTEQDAAQSLFESDINALADVVAGKSVAGDQIKLQFTGPVSLATELHLHNGERSLIDRGARRDIRDSFIAGASAQLTLVREAVPGAQVHLQFDEPYLEQALQGSIPTASGYRRYEPLDTHEVLESYAVINEALHALDVTTALNVADQTVTPRLFTGFDAVAYTHPGQDARAWEATATLVENGQNVWLASVDITSRQRIPAFVHQILNPWREVGLPTAQLTQLTLTERGRLEELAPGVATSVLSHLTETATALAETAQDIG